jgi:hypothetical protein
MRRLPKSQSKNLLQGHKLARQIIKFHGLAYINDEFADAALQPMKLFARPATLPQSSNL